TDFTELPPSVITVYQDLDVSVSRPVRRCTPGPANSYGQVLLVLFSKPMLQDYADVPKSYQLDNGITANGVQVQPGGRGVLLSMKEGIGAVRAGKMSVSGVTDTRGHFTAQTPISVQSDFRDGSAMTGRVLRADGSPATGVPVTLTVYDPWKDPFDRCEPII